MNCHWLGFLLINIPQFNYLIGSLPETAMISDRLLSISAHFPGLFLLLLFVVLFFRRNPVPLLPPTPHPFHINSNYSLFIRSKQTNQLIKSILLLSLNLYFSLWLLFARPPSYKCRLIVFLHSSKLNDLINLIVKHSLVMVTKQTSLFLIFIYRIFVFKPTYLYCNYIVQKINKVI